MTIDPLKPAVKFAECACSAAEEEWNLLASGHDAPPGVTAQYECETCGGRARLTDSGDVVTTG